MEGHHRGHFIMFCPMERHPRRCFIICIYHRGIQEDTFAAFLLTLGHQKGRLPLLPPSESATACCKWTGCCTVMSMKQVWATTFASKYSKLHCLIIICTWVTSIFVTTGMWAFWFPDPQAVAASSWCLQGFPSTGRPRGFLSFFDVVHREFMLQG